MIRALTINVWNKQGPWQRRLDLLRRNIAALDPDVTGVQEVLHLEGAGLNQAQELAAPLARHVAFAPAWPIAGGPLVMGNALLSRWPILEQRGFALPVEHPGEEGRALLYALVNAPDGRLPVYVTHLSWKFHQAHVRAQQVRAIDDVVRETMGVGGLPPILMGDFNAEPESDEIRFLRGLGALGGRGTYWGDCFALAGRGDGATFSRRNPYAADLREPERRIDYVFVRGPDKHKRGEPLAARVVLAEPEGDVWPSDHFGVYAEISLTRIDDQTRDFVSWYRRWRPELSPPAYHEFLVQRFGHKGPVPSVASIRAILEERGHVAPPALPEGRELDPPIPGTFAPNDVWCVDLVGGAAAVIDSYSRYLLRLDPVERDAGFEVEQTLRSAFREHGVPRVVRGRAAPPFLVDGPQGLSRLDLWLVRCGMVVNRRADAPFVSLPFAPPPAASFGERVRAADLFRKRHNQTEVVGYRSSTVPLRTPADVSELFIAETVDTDKHGKLRWSRFRLALGPELANTPISFWGSEWIRFVEVKIKDVALGMVNHLHPERGLIPAPIQGRLSMVPPTLEVDWEPILVAYLRDEAPASSRAARKPSRRAKR